MTALHIILKSLVINPVVVRADAPSLINISATVAVTKTTAVPLSDIALSELELSVTDRVSVVPLAVYVPLPISKLLPSFYCVPDGLTVGNTCVSKSLIARRGTAQGNRSSTRGTGGHFCTIS